MEMKTIGIAAIALVVGLISGYQLAPESRAGMHIMPDGSAMSDTMGGMMAGLEGKKGDDFDKAFIEEMIVHHEGAVSMAEALLANTSRPELQQLGNDIISAQTREIDMMRSWLRDWYAN
jgi:uncharacterized protein (DUF305 family)